MEHGKIYAVVMGEEYEGYSVRGIFSTQREAIHAAEHLVALENEDYGSYEQVKDVTRWTSGPCFIEIVEWPMGKLF
jgi:hypothetical protein